MLMALTVLFFAPVFAHDITALELSELSCDVLERLTGRLHADATRDILRVKVIGAEGVKYRNGHNKGLRGLYASMEYATYGPENVKVQKSRTRAVSGDLNPNWSEERCEDVYFPTDFIIEDSENDRLRITVSGEDLSQGKDDDSIVGTLTFSVKWLKSIIPQPMIQEPTVRVWEENREDLWSDYTQLHTVVFWQDLEEDISGTVQVQVSVIPRLPFWKKNLPFVRVYKRSVDGLKMKPQVETREYEEVVKSEEYPPASEEKETGFLPVETLPQVDTREYEEVVKSEEYPPASEEKETGFLPVETLPQVDTREYEEVVKSEEYPPASEEKEAGFLPVETFIVS